MIKYVHKSIEKRYFVMMSIIDSFEQTGKSDARAGVSDD